MPATVLSWTFVAVALVVALLPPALPTLWRKWTFAVLSLGGAVLVWRVPLVAVLAGAAAVYALGRLLPRVPADRRTWLLAPAIAAIVGMLAVLRQGGAVTSLVTTTSVIGVSYFALKFIQHLVDSAAGRTREVDLPAFLATIFFLPTYAAGPIERTDEFAQKLAGPRHGALDRFLGLERVVLGVAKKFLLADPLLTYADPIFRDPSSGSAVVVLSAVYAFALGLYLDFAGYSDIAIGIGRCAGIHVRENFDHPYLRRNLTLLWQHWHMSLTTWLRDFIFVPLTRRLLRATRNPLASQVTGQIVTMLLCGLWHGFAWHYAVWGVYNGIGLGALAAWRARRGPAPAGSPLRGALATLATFHFFAFGLVLFACELRPTARVFVHLLSIR
jgi:alginate O-acetyltransferase complex protein AlgI